jgi:hypothetical protein
MRDNLKLYVRGFFGSMNMSTETYQGGRNRPILSVFDLNPEALKHVVCNESVVEVYNQLIRRVVISTDFDYRERVLKVALRAFGVKNLQQWIMLQAESPTFTQLHADFLMDTVRYIATGKRQLPVQTWERLIGAGTNDPATKIVFDPAVLQMIPTGYSVRKQQPTESNLPNVLSLWLRHPGGFTDLVTTLYTLFGEHNTR